MTGTTSFTFLTPLGGLLVLAVVLPLAGLVLAERRVSAARALLRLARPPGGAPRATIVALAAVPVLLGLAVAQPALRAPKTANVRTDAEAMFVLDTSRSMLASAGPGEPSRLARAQRAAVRLRAAIADVPAGVGTLTDRALPNLLPIADTAAFDATVERAVGIERPPPQEVNVNATTLRAADRAHDAGLLLHVGAPQAPVRADGRRDALVRRRRGRTSAPRRDAVSR